MRLYLRGVKKGYATNSSSYHNLIILKEKDKNLMEKGDYYLVIDDSKKIEEVNAYTKEELKEKYPNVSFELGILDLDEEIEDELARIKKGISEYETEEEYLNYCCFEKTERIYKTLKEFKESFNNELEVSATEVELDGNKYTFYDEYGELR